MVDKDGKDPVNEEWVDDVVARAVERSLANSPEFVPAEIEDSTMGPSIDASPDTGGEISVSDDYEERNVSHKGNGNSPYPDEADESLNEEIEEGEHRRKSMKRFLEWGAVILGALLVAFLIKTFLMQAYFIPSSSMTPTLQVGDRVLVNKLSYKVGDIGRGDLVVFKRPANENSAQTDLIKRVIGLEGELIEILDGRIYITESSSSVRQLLLEPYLSSNTLTVGIFENTNVCEVSTETSCLIPDNHIFVLGDNRGGSRDSRFFGPIDEDMVVGRAFIRLWPISSLKFL
ncbi:MAG: signal peptidase I [Acidimicrobiales bacterium]|nr:signal peptidase I [Acidimicrobiales bacterium]